MFIDLVNLDDRQKKFVASLFDLPVPVTRKFEGNEWRTTENPQFLSFDPKTGKLEIRYNRYGRIRRLLAKGGIEIPFIDFYHS